MSFDKQERQPFGWHVPEPQRRAWRAAERTRPSLGLRDVPPSDSLPILSVKTH
jgi:hypothetical protein